MPYFYEPFLEAFDPALRKQLGVWYTPVEVVRYMVARVDKALKDDLGIPDGLAAENVYVLGPMLRHRGPISPKCCVASPRISKDAGLGALAGARVKQAATQRIFGFEIMPAPFVVAHLQVDLTLQDLDAPLPDDGTETRRRIPHQRTHRLGAENHQTTPLSRAGGRTRPRGAGEARDADPRDPRQPALQRLRGRRGG